MKTDDEKLNDIILEAAIVKKQLEKERLKKEKEARVELQKLHSIVQPVQLTTKTSAKSTATPVTMQQEKEQLPSLSSGKVKEIKKNSGLKFWDKWKLRRKPDSSYIISMEFSNGTCRDFVVSTKEETFMYRGRCYYLRYEDARFDLSRNQYKLMFHEDFCLPLSRSIHKEKPLDGDKWGAALRNVNSSNLKPLLSMEYIKILAENLISKLVKLILIVSILSLLIGIVSIIGIIKLGAFKGAG